MKSVRRLFNSFLPKHYNINIKINRLDRSFSGKVVINGQKVDDQQPLLVHAKDLTIISATINSKQVLVSSLSQDCIQLDTGHSHGEMKVEIEFSGKISDSMHGLYPCYYTLDGVKKEILTTQFESHFAREVFPCIDEPEAKATFELCLTTETEVKVLSNMPTKNQVKRGNHLITTFLPTPRMSTYLLAFVIGDLHSSQMLANDGTIVSIYTTKAHEKSKQKFALKNAVRILDFFVDYFKTPYPLPKIDHVAVPDFSAGAMENWGIVTYRENCLVVDEAGGQSAKELVATVIAHEISHQWFGNLVTMRWWNDLWLNESFANLMEYVAIDKIYPKWNIWQTFAVHESATALRRDHIAGVQPVRSVIRHPDEISTMFDPAIVYAKGSRLLNMLRLYIGEDTFRKGLQLYFKTHAYGNTESDDLWRSLSKYTKKDVGGLMASWLAQSGFPLVSMVSTKSGYKISQKRLVIGGHSEDNTWPIPLFANQKDLPTLFTVKTKNVTAKHTLPLLNIGNGSHFVTQYDKPAMNLILDALDANKLSAIDRLSLLHDTSLLARCDVVPYKNVVELINHFDSETEESVWETISLVLNDFKRFVENTDEEIQLFSLIQTLCIPLFDKLTVNEIDHESDAAKKLRSTLAGLLLYSNHKKTVDELIDLSRTIELDKVRGDMRFIIFCVIAKYGSKTEFAKLLKLHDQTPDPFVRLNALSALSTTSDPDHIALLLHRLLNTSLIKPQDLQKWYVALLKNPDARSETWEWMVNNWGAISKLLETDKLYDVFPTASAYILSTSEWSQRYTEFFIDKKDIISLRRAIEIGLIELQFRANLISKNREGFIESLNNSNHTEEKEHEV